MQWILPGTEHARGRRTHPVIRRREQLRRAEWLIEETPATSEATRYC